MANRRPGARSPLPALSGRSAGGGGLPSRFPLLIVLVLVGPWVWSCAQDVALVKEDQAGGIVAYPFTGEGDILSSARRGEAIRMIDEKCGRKYRIVREGELPKIRADIDRAWRGQMGEDRLWGLQFTCD